MRHCSLRLVTGGMLVAACLLGLPRPALAQRTAADTAAVLAALAAELRAEGRIRLADSLYSLIVSRYGNTGAAEVARDVLDEMRSASLASSGRGELIAWNTFYGAFLGVAIPAAFGAEDPEPYGVGLLLGPAIGYAASRAYGSSNPMSGGQARAMTFGSLWGTLQGLGWREALDIGGGEVCAGDVCFESDSDEAPFTAMVIGGLAGIGVGAALGRSIDISASTALIANFAALWGTWYGFTGGIIAGAEGDGLIAATLVAGNIGLVGAAVSASRWRWTRRRAWLVHLAGIAGLVGGFGLDLIAQPNEDEVAALIPTVTSAVGLIAGVLTTNDVSDAAAAPLEMSTALLNWRDGRFTFGTPLPLPAPVRQLTPDGRSTVVPGLRFELLRGRF